MRQSQVKLDPPRATAYDLFRLQKKIDQTFA
jgi:hypothetical protein